MNLAEKWGSLLVLRRKNIWYEQTFHLKFKFQNSNGIPLNYHQKIFQILEFQKYFK